MTTKGLFIGLFVLLVVLIPAELVKSVQAAQNQANKIIYYLLSYEPGPAWNSEAGLRQESLAQHQKYLMTLFNNDYLVLAGDLGQEGETLTVIRSETLEQARRLAAQDPAIKSDILKVKIEKWQIKLSSVRFVSRRSKGNPAIQEGPFVLKRIDPKAAVKQQKE